MAARKRVLFVSDHFGHAEGRIHGATRYFLTVLPRIDRELVDLSVCFLQGRHPGAAALEAQSIHPVFLNRAKWDLRALFDLKRIMRQREVEVVHAAGMKGIMLGRIAAHAAGVTAIIHLHDMNALSWPVRFAQRRLAKWTDRALVVSEALVPFATETFNLSARQVQVLHNGIVADEFADAAVRDRDAARRELGLAEGDVVIGSVGRLLPVKDHPTLFRALVEVRRQCPRARVLIVGDGPSAGSCKRMVRTLGLESAVIFAGQRNDMPRMYAAMDVVAMPSLREGYPYAALEALAAGKPVVASIAGGLPEIVQSGENGLLVPPQQPTALARALIQAITPGPQRDALVAGARRHGQQHDITQHVRTLEQLYLNATAGKEQTRITPGIQPQAVT